MKFTIIAQGEYSDEWPEIEVWVNDICQGRACIEGNSELDFDIGLTRAQNVLRLEYTNKQEHHTKTADGAVIADQVLTLQQIRIDDTLSHGTKTVHWQDSFFARYRDRMNLHKRCLEDILADPLWHKCSEGWRDSNKTWVECAQKCRSAVVTENYAVGWETN